MRIQDQSWGEKQATIEKHYPYVVRVHLGEWFQSTHDEFDTWREERDLGENGITFGIADKLLMGLFSQTGMYFCDGMQWCRVAEMYFFKDPTVAVEFKLRWG